MNHFFFIYGPSGSGKSTLGRRIAKNLALPFFDLDGEIEARARQNVAGIFTTRGEAGFRRLEASCLADLLAGPAAVVALGGGSLLDQPSRARVEAAGQVLCLTADLPCLMDRLQSAPRQRPLLGAPNELQARLSSLLEARSQHYASFALKLDTSHLPIHQAAFAAQARLGAFRVNGMGPAYDVRVIRGGLTSLGEMVCRAGLKGPLFLVSDAHTGPLYAETAAASLEGAGFRVAQAYLPAGEEHKTMETVQSLWQGFLAAGLERSSTLVALGGGVTGDLAGFAAATYLRGVRWVNVPTTLLAMVDAGLGGKTGANLPQGKNLVGAFHPPSLVLVDPDLLASLPQVELRNGLAEVVKHGLIGDPALFDHCAAGWEGVTGNLDVLVRRAMAVKIRLIQADPYEKGPREALNLGHTVGHALEKASGYRLRHGEAVSIGLVCETRLAERLGLARPGLADSVASVLAGLGLPVQLPAEIDPERLLEAMQYDKKKAGGSLRLSLPQRIGKVKTGIIIPGEELSWMLKI